MATNEEFSLVDELRTTNAFVPLLAACSSLIAFALVISLSMRVVGRSLQTVETAYAISMGLLGSSLFLLYNLIGVMPEQRFRSDEVAKNLARLFVGPVAGWLSYFMYVIARSDTAPAVGPTSPRPIAGTAHIWLPFLVGFSSDLMVGIINQGVRAIKFTLGLEKMERRTEMP